MEYINDININEAVIHILDSNAEEPILNEYKLELNEDIYTFLYKHIEKCFKDEDLKYGKFNLERNIVKEVSQDYLNGVNNDLVGISKELARQLFIIMKGNENIPAGDLIVVSIVTDQGPMVGILKLDYVENYTHEVQFLDNKIDIGIVPQAAGLPGSSQKIQKAAFIKPIGEEERYNLMVLDKQKGSKDDEYGANYFIKSFLGANLIVNERDMTKTFVKAAENWTRKNITEDAGKAEEIRTAIKTKLREEDKINIDEFSNELFSDDNQSKEEFSNYIKQQGLNEDVAVDKTWVEKKLKRVRLNIDKQIDLYINQETYHDPNKFEIIRNGDGSINLVVKNVINYIEK
ncbi:nucleoid-associated protein [Clostridium sp. SM-530-WT-3G]|uniref:nucleoid-associated protein n=1 Tax=Clostridium sp. SM-530-WT-3G TaxID=2725303 RepID=UPI00145DD520|nr:nucleoid-associated protein [Clostridium sp. SM-530-WT-3G]NME82895.1 nucleoid-associated protein [Clostridium sp. SM-530-WT-3G]